MQASDRIVEALLKAASVGREVSLAERHGCTIAFKNQKKQVSPVVDLAVQVVTSADLAVQEAVLQSLLNSGLEDCVIHAEEDTPSVRDFGSGKSATSIFVDPIDGTLAYSLENPGWNEAALGAGFQQHLLDVVREKTDSRLFGMVLGARFPNAGIVSVCALPELGIVYHCYDGSAFRNDTRLEHRNVSRTSKIAIARTLLNANTMRATHFDAAGLDVQWFTGSSPGVLWYIFEDGCTGYAGLNCSFDVQLASVIGKAAGLIVTDRNGDELHPPLTSPAESVVFTPSPNERDRICEVIQHYH